MKYWTLYIKSHVDAPDYEDECEANDKLHAAHIFAKRINSNRSTESDDWWDAEELVQYIDELD